MARKSKTEEVKLDKTLPPILEEQIPVVETVDLEQQAQDIINQGEGVAKEDSGKIELTTVATATPEPAFGAPQPSAPVEVVIEPVKREKVEVDKIMLFKALYSLGLRQVYHYSGVSLVNKIGDIFGLSKEDGAKKWEEIKETVSKL